MTLTYPERISRLNKHIGQGRVIRNKYKSTDSEGRVTVCLLAALSPEVAIHESPNECPAEVMPEWLATLTLTIDDNGTHSAWDGTIRRYAKLAADWHVLSPQAWNDLAIKALQVAMLEAKQVVPDDLWGEVNERLEQELVGNSASEDYLRGLRGKISAFMNEEPSSSKYGRRVMLRALYPNEHRPPDSITSRGTAAAAWKAASRCNDRCLPIEREAVDRMTNLLFDAIQKEIDLAKEEAS